MSQIEIPHGWKKTILVPLVRIMFKSCGSDLDATWEQATQLVRAYAPKTDQEFRMVVRMAMLNAQGNLCFAESVDTPTTQSQAIRLRSIGLTTLNAADKAELRLEKLTAIRVQKAATAPTTATAPATTPAPAPAAAPAATRPTPAAATTAAATPQKAPPAKTPQTTADRQDHFRSAPRLGAVRTEASLIVDDARLQEMTYTELWDLHQSEMKAAANAPKPG